jgi:hypothetical protein
VNVGGAGERPWSPTDLRTSLSAGVVAVVLVLWAWRSATGSAEVDEQVVGLALSVVGALAAIVGASLWVVGGRHAVSARRRVILDRLELLAATGPVVLVENGPPELVVVAGRSRYHHQDCLLVRGKRVERLGPAMPPGRELRPCEMCRS